MRVTFNDIADRAYTTLLTDYKLDNLLKKDESAFYSFLSGFLVNSIDIFDGCLTNLNYHTEKVEDFDEETGKITTKIEYVFDADLTSKEAYILSLGVAMGLYRKELDDTTQYRLHLTSKNFKAHSEQQNLQRRLERYGALEEEFSNNIQAYQLSNFDKLPFFGEV